MKFTKFTRCDPHEKILSRTECNPHEKKFCCGATLMKKIFLLSRTE